MQPKDPNSALSRWQRLGSRILTGTRIFNLLGVTYRHPLRGTEREFFCIDAPDWVNVLAITQDQRVVLVRQFRYGTNEFSLELPGGVVERGEDPLQAGLRELSEETGYGGGQARIVGRLHPNPAIQANHFHAVLVENVAKLREVHWDADEELEVSTVSLPELVELIRTEKITHSLTACAFMLYLANRGRSLV